MKTELGNDLSQIDGETDYEFSVFLAYVLLPDPKSLTQLANHYNRSAAWASKMCKKNDWKSRCVKSEVDQMTSIAMLRDKDLARRAEQVADLRVQAAEKAVKVANIAMSKWLEHIADSGDHEAISIQEATKLLEVASKVSRLENGEPTTIKEMTQVSNVTYVQVKVEGIPEPVMLDDNFAHDDIVEGDFTLEELSEMKPE